MTGLDDVLTTMVIVGRAIGVATIMENVEGATSRDIMSALLPAIEAQRALEQVDPVAARVAQQQIHAFLHGRADEPIEGTATEQRAEIEA